MNKREYDYIRGNTALDPKRIERNIEKKVQKQSQIKKQKALKIRQNEFRKTLVKNILQIASVTLVLGVITIARNGSIYKVQKNLADAKNQISKSNEQGEALRVDLLKYSSVSDVKQIATKSKMIMPNSKDSVSIDLSKDFFPNLPKN